MKFEVTFGDGTLWIGEAANNGAAAKKAIAEVFAGQVMPDSVTLTIELRRGGAIIRRPEQTES